MDYLQRIKEELDLMSDEHRVIAVSRKDLEKLIEELEKHRSQSE